MRMTEKIITECECELKEFSAMQIKKILTYFLGFVKTREFLVKPQIKWETGRLFHTIFSVASVFYLKVSHLWIRKDFSMKVDKRVEIY
jgi:hypothetical protein